jgi:two-component system, OmpR family, phosphate regulon sensor histidine kinase PhoR
MNIQKLQEVATLIERERDTLLTRWRGQVRQLPSAKGLDTPTLNDHVPVLLDELVTAFRSASDETIPEALLEGSPPLSGDESINGLLNGTIIESENSGWLIYNCNT